MKNELSIIGRQKEIQKLHQLMESRQGEFIAIYGRRRVGKTFLITQFSKQTEHYFLYVVGSKNGSKQEQLDQFKTALFQTFNLGINPETVSFQHWKQAFSQLQQFIEKNLPKNKKIILFFDELPWLATKRSKLIHAIDYFWNRHWSLNPQVKLIVCGSAASWMLSHIINEKGGLYNRVTDIIKLEPFDLKTTQSYLASKGIRYQQQQVLEIYMAFGGIPHYLNFIRKGFSPAQNIDNTCFLENEKLRSEFEKLFASLFESHEAHEEIVRVLAKHHYGLERTALVDQLTLSKDGGRLSKRLEELEASGFIKSITPQAKTHGLIYKVTDEYTLFYLNWIEKTKHGKITGNYWASKINTPAYFNWAGYAFEALCEKHLKEISQTLAIPDGSIAYNWLYTAPKGSEEPGTQIDLLFDRPDNTVTLCEIKHCGDPFKIDKNYAKILQNKVFLYKKYLNPKKNIFIAFITINGIKETMYSEELVQQVMTLPDFFS